MPQVIPYKNCLSQLFLLSVILLPFYNDFPLFSSHNFARSPSFYPILCILVVLTLYNFTIFTSGGLRIRFTDNIVIRCFFIFIVWALFSGVYNIDSIMHLESIKTNGISVYSKNIVLLILYFLVILSVLHTLERDSKIFQKLRATCLVSFLLVIPYSTLEILSYYYNVPVASTILSIIEPIFHDRIFEAKDGLRVRGYAFEPSYFSLYIAFVFPWIFSYGYSSSKSTFKNVLIVSLLITIIIFSGSRITYIVVFSQVALFLLIRMRFIGNMKSVRVVALTLIVFCVVVFLNLDKFIVMYNSLTGFESNNVSNVTRLASIHAAILLGNDYPVFGVGYGLAGAYLPDYYPQYAWLSYEMPEWSNLRDTELGSPVFSMIPRTVAEVGYIGAGLLFTAWITTIYYVYKQIAYKFIRDKEMDYVGVAIMLSLVGMLIGSLGVDGFNFLGYWLGIGIAAAYINRYSTKKFNKSLLCRLIAKTKR